MSHFKKKNSFHILQENLLLIQNKMMPISFCWNKKKNCIKFKVYSSFYVPKIAHVLYKILRTKQKTQAKNEKRKLGLR